MIKLLQSIKLQAFFSFLFVSAVIVSTWFRGDFIYGGAEVGIFTYHPERWLEMSRYVWWDTSFPGQLVPQFITGVPLYFFFYVLKLIGLSPQNIQQIFFTGIIFLMGFGMFLLAFDIFDKTRQKYALVAGLFYIFNAYALVQIWHRFVYSIILLAAVLPLLILLWRKWIREGKIIYLILFLLINFVSVYIYGNLAAVITIWTAFLMISLGECIFPWQGKLNAKRISLKFLVGFTFWILTNMWWILPTFSISPGLLSQQHTGEDNLATLVVISRQTIMPYLLQLVNPFYLFLNSELGTIYSDAAFKVIPWVMSGFIFWGLLIGLKTRYYAGYSIFFVVSVLLAKGAAIPFSYPFIFAFKNSYFLGILRNPFEKLGIMLPLFGAILFALGIQSFFVWGTKRLGSNTTKMIVILIIILLLGYAWPMWGSFVFGTKKWPIKVKVPESYTEANDWLRQQRISGGVILHLPFSGKDVVTYDWQEGYHGVDQNDILFTSLPSLSRAVGIKRIDDTLVGLTKIFNPPFSANKKQILRLLRDFNVRFIVLHKDIKWNDQDTYGDRGVLLDPNKIEQVLDGLEFLWKERQFGSLVIYKIMEENFKPALTLTDNIQIVYLGQADIMQILEKTAGKGEIITPVFYQPEREIIRQASQVLIFPDKRIDYFESSASATITQANDLFNELVSVRNYFLSLGDLPSEEVVWDLILSTQNLSQLSSADKFSVYKESIMKFLNNYETDLNLHSKFGNRVRDMLKLHLVVLRQIGDKEISGIIENRLVKWELFPEYQVPGTVFKFNVPWKSDYSLLVPSQIDEADIKLNGASIGSQSAVIKSGGKYEISYNSRKGFLNEDLILKFESTNESVPVGKILNFNKVSPVSYSGRIALEKPTFINFAQGFHSGWILTLNQEGKNYKIDQHFLGNLYDNIWWVDKIGEYDFKIEFLPQRQINRGITVALSAFIFLLLTGIFIYIKGRFKK